MSVTNHGQFEALTAAADLSTKQFYLVKRITETTCNLTTAITDKVVGSIANKPTSGETVSIAAIDRGATIKVKLGGTVALDAEVSAGTDGRAITAAGTGTRAFGRAMQAGVANDVIEVMCFVDRVLA